MKRALPISSALALTLTLASAAPAYAGRTSPAAVTIQGTLAYGSQVSARNSLDHNQMISCAAQNLGASPYVTCYATDAAGTAVQCTSTDASIVAVASTVTGRSYIMFTWSSSTGKCATLYVDNGSEYQ